MWFFSENCISSCCSWYISIKFRSLHSLPMHVWNAVFPTNIVWSLLNNLLKRVSSLLFETIHKSLIWDWYELSQFVPCNFVHDLKYFPFLQSASVYFINNYLQALHPKISLNQRENDSLYHRPDIVVHFLQERQTNKMRFLA